MTTARDLQRIGQGREAEIFLWPDGGVLKLYRSREYEGSRAIEAAAMGAAKAAGAPAPAALELVEVDGLPGLVMERVAGMDLLTRFGKQPWTVVSGGQAMGEAHARLHEVAAPGELPPLRERLLAHLEGSPLIPDDLRPVAREALRSLPDGDALCHGDFHPGNVILTPEGPRVIDWPNAFAGDPHADVARTHLLMRLGEVPPGTSPALRVLAKVGRRIMLYFYERGYRSQRPLDEALVRRWLLPAAIARLGEGIEAERDRTLALIEELRAGG